MFVVRTIQDDDNPSFKAFSRSADARAYFNQFWEAAFDGEMRSAVLFEVADTEDVWAAVDAVKRGDVSGVVLLQKPGPLDHPMTAMGLQGVRTSDWRRPIPVGPSD
jgi:hypothetical protein